MPKHNDQDWEPTGWNKKGEIRKDQNKSQVLNNARRKGNSVTTSKRIGGGANRQGEGAENHTRIDEESEPRKLQSVSAGLKVLIQRERCKAGVRTQKELATMCNLKASIIQAYEGGTAVPSPMILRRIEVAIRSKNPKFEMGTLTKARKKV